MCALSRAQRAILYEDYNKRPRMDVNLSWTEIERKCIGGDMGDQ